MTGDQKRVSAADFVPLAERRSRPLCWGVTLAAILVAVVSGIFTLGMARASLAGTRGASLYNSGHPGRAYPLLKEAVAASSLQAGNCTALGDMAVWALDDAVFQTFYRIEDPWELAKLALASYVEALERHPGDPRAWAGIGELFKKSRLLRIKEGVVDLDLLGDEAPASYDLEDRLAIEAYRKAVEFEPNNYFYHAYLGDFYDERGFRREALASYGRAVEIMPDLSWHYYLPDRGLPEDIYQSMRESLERALVTNPSYPKDRVYQNLGDLSERGGDQEAAADYYKQAAAVAVDPSPYLQMLGALYFSMGRYDESDDALKRALERDTLQPRMKALAHTLLGRSASLRGDQDLAVDHLKKARWLNPHASYIAINLARLYESMGKVDLAESEFKAAIKIDPARAGSYSALIQMYRRTHQLNKALPLARRLVEMFPDQPVFRNQLEKLNRELGRTNRS